MLEYQKVLKAGENARYGSEIAWQEEVEGGIILAFLILLVS